MIFVFEDDFGDSRDGEFPPHWNLLAGQSVVNKVGDKMTFLLTEDNYAKINVNGIVLY